MDSKVTQSSLYDFVQWADKNRKALIASISAVAIIGAIWYGYSHYSQAQEENASEALSNLRPVQVAPNSPGVIPAQEYLRLADANAKTSAGERALLLAGAALFTEGKYAEAFSQFEKFIAEHPESQSRAEAALGAAAALDAQGKIAEATTRYKDVTDRFAGSAAAVQAKFALGRLYEAQNKLDMAIKAYEELQKEDPQGSIGGFYAKLSMASLTLKNPGLKPSGVTPPAIP